MTEVKLVKDSSLHNRRLSIFIFSLFSSWLLSMPYEGRVLYAVAGQYGMDVHKLIFSCMIAYLIGLFGVGFIVRKMRIAKRLFLLSTVICMLASLVFFFPPTLLWNISLVTASFCSGGCIASWSIYFKAYTSAKQRLKTVADVLVLTYLLLILINSLAIYLFPEVGLACGILLLGIAFLMTLRLPEETPLTTRDNKDRAVHPVRPMVNLCLFIALLTINAGLMYKVVIPAYSHIGCLVGWYWAIPYLITIMIMKNLPPKINRHYILYVAVAMFGLSFIAFMASDRSLASYLFVNTLMLGARGICDLFWWSTLGEMLEWSRNPVKIFGIGLSANVVGILLGGVLGDTIKSVSSNSEITSLVALVIIFIIILFLPLLHTQLSLVLEDHINLTHFTEIPTEQYDKILKEVIKIKQLTDRESEIAMLLMRGKTYKMIAEELFLSENTIKTHIKNIYAKLEIQNKAQLVKYLLERKSMLESNS